MLLLILVLLVTVRCREDKIWEFEERHNFEAPDGIDDPEKEANLEEIRRRMREFREQNVENQGGFGVLELEIFEDF